MQLLKFKVPKSKDEIISILSDNDRVNAGRNFDKSKGVPFMKLKTKGDKIRMTCEMQGRATRDNGFIVGTYMSARLKEDDGVTTFKGVIWTAPLYHLIIIALFAYFVFQCIKLGGISVYPILIVIMDIMLFYGEFKKQKMIKSYVLRAMKKLMKGE